MLSQPFSSSENVVSPPAENGEYYRRQLEAICNNATVALFIMDERQQCAYMNPAAEKLTGFSLAEVHGKALHNVIHHTRPDGRPYPLEECPIDRAFPENSQEQGEDVFVHKDGTFYSIAFTASPICENGVPTGTIIEVRDITEERRAEREQKRFFQLSLDMLCIATSDGYFKRLNPAFTQTLGWSEKELLSQSIAEFIHPDDVAEFSTEFNRLSETALPIHLENRFRCSDGTYKWLTWSCAPFAEEKLIYAVAHDITERRHRQRTLQLMVELNQATQPLANADEIMAVTARMLGEHLEVNRCAYAEVGTDQDSFEITGDYTRDTFSILGSYTMSMFGEEVLRLMRLGEYYVVNNAQTDPRTAKVLQAYHQIEMLAVVCVPLHKEGRFVAAMAVHQKVPRHWTAAEIELIRLVVNRCWEAIERARAMRGLGQSEERLRFMAESMPQKIFTASPTGAVDYFNQQWIEFTGLSYEQIQDWGWTQFIHPDDVEENIRSWKYSVSTGDLYQIEHRFRRADGVYRWHLSRAHPMRDASGQILMWIGSNTDIDDIKRAQEWQEFLAQAGNAISSLDYQETLKNVAQLAVPTLADWCTVDILEDAGVLQRLAIAHVDPEKVQWAIKLGEKYAEDPNSGRGIYKVLETGEPIVYSEITDELLVTSAKNAEHLQLLREIGFESAMLVPLLAHGRTLGVISLIAAESGRRYQTEDLALAQDIANRAALAIDNARLYRDAQQTNRLKDEFLATMSHELRTPMTAILGWSQMLLAANLDEETAASALQTIERSARSQVRLIDDLLDVSRIVTGKLRLDVRSFALPAVVEAAADAVRPMAEAKNIRLQVLLDPQAGPVSGDPDRLQQVVWNLLSNALKFTPKGGRVQVRLERINSHVEITVSDTGQGISGEFLPHVFDRFRQADSTNTRAQGGLGLGLAIVRQLVELHGGSVHVESPGAGQGATFIVNLPVTVIHQPRSTPADEGARVHPRADNRVAFACPPSLDGLRVLAVDDEKDARDLILAVLEKCKVHVTTVASVAEAMEAIEKSPPDILISDIGMPGEDGYSLIQKVRGLPAERGGRIPALAMTAYARAEDRVNVLAAGFQMHLAKPVEAAELVMVVSSLAERAVKK